MNNEAALDAFFVQEDDAHIAVRLSIKSFYLSASDMNWFGLRANIILSRLDSARLIVNEIRQALHLDYGIRNVVTLSSKPLRWSQRVAYTDPITNHRWVYDVGDYVSVRQSKARLEQCFTMRFRDHPQPYVFLIVRHLHKLHDDDGDVIIDHVLGLPVYRGSSQQAVYGLPALANQLFYFVQAPTEGPWATDIEVGGEDDDGQIVLLECEWKIAHM
jgi:hypothetical protein